MSAGDSRLLSGVVDALVASAVRRWPPSLRDEQCREWTAELAALHGEPQAGQRRFTFALSLALSPAPDDGSGRRGWRELLPGFGVLLRPAFGFAVLSLLVMQVWPLRLTPSGSGGVPLGVLLALAVVPLCYLIGRRSTLPATNLVSIAGVAAIGAALGYLAYRTVPLLVTAWVLDSPTGALPLMHHGRVLPGDPPPAGDLTFSPQGHVAAALVFVALTVPLLAGVLFLTARRRWSVGIPLACLGLPVVALLSWSVGVVAAPGPVDGGSFFDPVAAIMDTRFDRGPFGHGEVETAVRSVGVLLLLGAMVTAYGLGLATRGRARATAALAPPDDSAPAWTLSRAATAAGGVAAAVGLAAWIYPTSILPPQAGRSVALAAVSAESGDELRWGAVILAVLGIRIAAAHRRSATLAALLAGGWLLVSEAVLTRTPLLADGLPVGTAAAIAVIGIGLAWWVSGRRSRLDGADAIATRRSLAVAAVVAAACGPLLIAQVDVRHDAATASGLTVLLSVVPATSVALAVFAAAAARRRPIRPLLAATLAAAPAAATAAAGLATTMTSVDEGVTLLTGAAGAGLFAVGAAALALARHGRAPHRAGWAAAAALAPFVLAPAAFYAAIVPDMLLKAIGGADAYLVATSFQPGVLLVVLPAAAVLARRLITLQPGLAGG